MPANPLELNFRLSPDFGAADFLAVADELWNKVGFDEETHYELMAEDAQGGRLEDEILHQDLGRLLDQALWSRLHLLLLSNQWIKGMNAKLQVVRRQDHSLFNLKLDLDRPGAGGELAAWLQERLARWQRPEEKSGRSPAEHERLFGAMLLHESVAGQARQLFLQGDFQGSLLAAYRVLTRLAERLGSASLGGLEQWLTQEPPRVLFPELSGRALRLELEGLGKLAGGLSTLLDPVLTGRQKLTDPAPALKYLVLISLLVERLESAAPNPALKKRAAGRSRAARRKAPAARRARVKPSRKKTSSRGRAHKRRV